MDSRKAIPNPGTAGWKIQNQGGNKWNAMREMPEELQEEREDAVSMRSGRWSNMLKQQRQNQTHRETQGDRESRQQTKVCVHHQPHRHTHNETRSNLR